MDDAELRRRYGQVFDAVAEEYDRARPTYPDQLVEAACRRGELGAGDWVVEVGCGTGHLTAALLARGLRVEAVEPGANMIGVAARRVGDAASVRFHRAKFEDVEMPEGAFAAVFSATAFHWVDPAIGWGRAATLLRPGGMLALIQYCNAWDERTAAAGEALFAALGKVAPDVAAGLPRPREATTILAGAQERRDNISEVWSWIGRHELAVPEGARLFDDVRITTVPVFTEQTAEQLNAQLRTTSLYARIASDRRERLEAENERIAERFGGAIRWSELAVLVTARRARRNSSRPSRVAEFIGVHHKCCRAHVDANPAWRPSVSIGSASATEWGSRGRCHANATRALACTHCGTGSISSATALSFPIRRSSDSLWASLRPNRSDSTSCRATNPLL